MKRKTAKQVKQAKAAVQLKDLKPKKNAKGGAVTKGGWVLDTSYERLT